MKAGSPGILGSLASFGFLAALAWGCAGCGAPPAKDSGAEAWSVGADPCAERLHELCGPLLLHFALRGRLPERLEDLAVLSDGPLELACPVSGKPYVYERQGVAVEGKPGLVVVRDPEAVHSGLFWAISVLPAEGGATLTTRVIAVPESAFESPKPSEP